MLRFMRRAVKSLPAKVLIGLLVASFAVWGIGDIFRLRLATHVAKVGDTEVSAEMYSRALQREQQRISRQAKQSVTMDMMRAAGLDRRVLGGLVRDAAFTEEMRGLGIAAPDSEVAKTIQANPAFKGADGKFSAPDYHLLLAREGFSATQFEELTRTLLGQQILVETIDSTAPAPPGVGARIAAWRGEERTASALSLPLDKAPDPGTPDDAALKTYYDAHQAEYTEPERRWARYVHVDAEKLIAALRPDDATLMKHYEAEKASYTKPETRKVDQVNFPDRAAAEAAMSALVSGDKTFDQIATDRGVKPEDLSLGDVTKGDLPPAAADVVFGTEKPGIVGPVELPAGFAVFRVVSIEPGGVKSFDEVKDQIAERLAREALVTKAPEVANKVEELRAGGQSLQDITKETDTVYGEVAGLARDGTLADGKQASGFEASPAFIDEVFKALDHEERDLVETKAGGYFLVMVDRVAQSAVHPLDEVRDKVTAGWQDQERLTALEAKGKELAARLGAGTSTADLATELGLTAQDVPSFTRGTAPPILPQPLVTELFRLPMSGGASAPAGDGKSVVVAQVTAITPLPSDAVEIDASRIDAAFSDSLKRDMSEYFSRAIEARHPASFEPQVINQVLQRLGATAPAGQ